MDRTGSLEGRIAVVTGAGQGLGRSIAERLEKAGAHIVAVDLPGALGALPPGWEGQGIDLASDDARPALDRLAVLLEPVAVVVSNAGIVPPWRGVSDLDLAEWDRVMRVNVWAVASTLGAFAESLAASGHGSAIVMASINGYRAHPRQVLYTASKHAAIGVMRAAALDLGGRGVRVNALAPGPVATEALRLRLKARHAAGGPPEEDALASYGEQTALGRIVTTAEVAEAALFLASDASSGMTGLVLPVEAGLG
jgi:NAD(P)-dependent dehydrogenase (short-subunit alcohol dehydrogenase family)